MNNVHQHARATRLDVALHRASGRTVLRIADDGIGFDPSILVQRVSEGHIGLASLVVAVESAGGSVDFSSGPGGGAVVTVTVPDEVTDEA
jgi:two-component system NarL family sensor kinase